MQDHPSFIGCYFPGFSSPASIAHCYEAADAIFFVGEELLTVRKKAHACIYSRVLAGQPPQASKKAAAASLCAR